MSKIRQAADEIKFKVLTAIIVAKETADIFELSDNGEEITFKFANGREIKIQVTDTCNNLEPFLKLLT